MTAAVPDWVKEGYGAHAREAMIQHAWDIRAKLTYKCEFCGFSRLVNFGRCEDQMYGMLEFGPPVEICPNPECAIAAMVQHLDCLARSKVNYPEAYKHDTNPEHWEQHLRNSKTLPDAWWIYLQLLGEAIEALYA